MSGLGESKSKALLFGAAATGVGLLYAGYLLLRKKDSKSENLPREVAIKILKEIRREFYPVFRNIMKATGTVVLEHRQQYGRNLSPDAIVRIRDQFMESPQFKNAFEEIESQIHAKHAIENAQKFEEFCRKLAEEDEEVASLMNQIGNMIELGVPGGSPKCDFEIPESVTALSVLRCQKRIHQITLRLLAEHIQTAEETSEAEALIKQKELERETLETIKKFGFDLSEDWHPEQIFEKAAGEFVRNDPSFKTQLIQLNQLYQKILNQLTLSRGNVEEILNDIATLDRMFTDQEKQASEEKVEAKEETKEEVEKTVEEPYVADIEKVEEPEFKNIDPESPHEEIEPTEPSQDPKNEEAASQ